MFVAWYDVLRMPFVAFMNMAIVLLGMTYRDITLLSLYSHSWSVIRYYWVLFILLVLLLT